MNNESEKESGYIEQLTNKTKQGKSARAHTQETERRKYRMMNVHMK